MERTSPSDEIQLRVLLSNLAMELRRLSISAAKIENQVGEAISGSPADANVILTHLQGLDLLAQTANEMASFAQGISESLDLSISVSVSGKIGAIKLRSLADSLAGRSNPELTEEDAEGEVVFLQ